MVRRAKQFSDLTIMWNTIPFSDLTAVLHTDASWGNAQRHGTQAGYIIGFTTKSINTGAEVPWTPWIWRSYRLQRVVPSTLSGEAQSLACGLGMLEWAMLHISEWTRHITRLRGGSSLSHTDGGGGLLFLIRPRYSANESGRCRRQEVCN